MTYNRKYQGSPTFPYKKVYKKNTYSAENKNKSNNSSEKKLFDFEFLHRFLIPIEKYIGRKICFDDILLILLIYMIFTEENDENKTLLFCLIFILLG